MDAHDDDFLVVGAVEDPDLSASRQLLLVTPQVVVVELLAGRDAEPVHDDALRVHAAHHVPDGAVLAAGVQGLQHQQDAVGVLGREARLVVVEHLHARREQALAVLLVEHVARVPGIEVAFQHDLGAGLNPERLDDLANAFETDVFHRRGPWRCGGRTPSPRADDCSAAQLVDIDVPGADVLELEHTVRDERVLQNEVSRLIRRHALEQRV